VTRSAILPQPSNSLRPFSTCHASRLMPPATVSIPSIACVLKSAAWCTAFDCVSPHTYTTSVITLNAPAENNLRRETLINSNISKCYKNVLHWLRDHTVEVKIIVTSCARNVLRSECPVKFLLSLDNTHHAEVREA